MNILIANFFTKMMYRPVNQIIKHIGGEDKANADSEYDFIEKIVLKNAQEREQMEKDLYKQKKSRKNDFFEKVLKGRISESKIIAMEAVELGFTLPDKDYRILLVEIENNPDIEITFAQFIISNIFGEFLSEYYEYVTTNIEARVAFVLEIDETSPLPMSLSKYFEKTLDMIWENFALKCTIGIGENHESIKEIHTAYNECVELVVHSNIFEDRRIISQEDLDKLSNQYHFSSDEENRLMLYMNKGDYKEVSHIIQKVITYNLEVNPVKFTYMQCLMFLILGTMIKTVNDSIFTEMLDGKDVMQQLMYATSVDEMKVLILDMAKTACELHVGENDSESRISIRQEVDQYIQEHYSDVNLNVSYLGEIFNMTPTYLSRLYKKETGNSVLQAINTVRIDASKQLLLESNMTINEIAFEVGYLYSNAFIRFFKNQTGVTPGQYKTIYK
jgi:AraC-like DNA-binding protein